MVPAKYHHEYRRNEISTSSQGKLILMMYEGAMKFTRMALHSLEKGDISGKGLYIQKTHDIINELSVSLNLKKGGEVASKLETLYQFILSQLTLANIKSDREALESILKVLHPLEEAWRELLHGSNGQDVEQPRIPKSIASKI